MMDFIKSRLLPRRNYVGTVSSETRILNEDGSEAKGRRYLHVWTLTEHNWFGRRSVFKGNIPIPGYSISKAARAAQRGVFAWVAGGPLPKLDEETKIQPPAPVISLVEGSQ